MSPKDPAWLPGRICFEDHDGDMESYVEMIYKHFREDFIDSKPNPFKGKHFGLKRYPEKDGKEATFWHMITEKDEGEEREVELPRCERIRWPRPVIDEYEAQGLKCWEQKRRGETRWAIALDGFSYLVVIAIRSSYVLPWTAFPLDRSHTRLKYYREYLAYCEDVESPGKRLEPPRGDGSVTPSTM